MITIQESSGYTIEVQRDKLYEVVPDSLFTTTLDMDSTATDIEFSVPLITPSILQFLEW